MTDAPYGIKIEHEHNLMEDYHQWVFLPGYKDLPSVAFRDAIGRKRNGWRRWIPISCNNTKCPAFAIVREELLLDYAARWLPVPPRKIDE